mgnify:CR=1 FL=1
MSRLQISLIAAAVLALGFAGSAVAAGPVPSVPTPNQNAIQNETQMPAQIDKNAQQNAEDKKREEEAKAKAKADAMKNGAETPSK